MAIQIVDLPIETGDFPWFFVCLPGRVTLGAFYYPLDLFGWPESMDWEVGPPLWPPLLSTQPGHAKELFFNKGVQGFGGAVRSLQGILLVARSCTSYPA